MGFFDDVYQHTLALAKKSPQLVIGVAVFGGGYYSGRQATLYELQESYGILKEIPAIREENKRMKLENEELRKQVGRLTVEVDRLKQRDTEIDDLRRRMATWEGNNSKNPSS
jgi:hypothetical protein